MAHEPYGMFDASHAPSAGSSWHNYFLILLDRMPLPVAVCRADGEILIANPAMAAVWGTTRGRLRGRNLLDHFSPRAISQVGRLVEAVRMGRRSRYPVEVRWHERPDGPAREGMLTLDPVGDPSDEPPALLAILRVHEDRPAPPQPAERLSPVESRILALAASGATTAAIGKDLGLTVDGVNYHLTRLTRRFRVPNRTALIARAYTLGLLSPTSWPPTPTEHRDA
ncbi:LuxR C-terminal-related transcriptional regulator [Streptomyces sp. NPDC000151]|uniref:helix-turn-helix transcriptional regulator n=1 Tax=Streptomyces sp. NPDC000151 TaxID=3154244 RepID=UPI00333257F7